MKQIFKILIFVFIIFARNGWAEVDSISDSDKEQENLICSYPQSLQTALELNINKPCQQIHREDLSQVKQIHFMDVVDIFDIHSDHFEYLTSLKKLDFSQLKSLTHIPDFVFDMTSLKSLDISATGISNFDFRLCRLKQMESFVGHSNTYENNEIPFHTFCLENLKVLDMSNSGIIYIDEYLYYLKSLETLKLRDNSLSVVPMVLPFLSSLQTVDFRGNDFQNKKLNSLKDCSKEIHPEDVKDCVEDLKSNFECEGYDRFIYERGVPLRRYKTMTDEEFFNLEIQEGPIMNRCYQSWLIRQGGFDSFVETSGFDEQGRYKGRESLNASLLQRTINGKTVREWRLVLKLKKEILTSGEGLWSFFRQRSSEDGIWVWQEKTGSAGYLAQGYRGIFNLCSLKRSIDNWIGIKDENHTPDESEVFPEENRYEDFEEQEEWRCQYDQ